MISKPAPVPSAPAISATNGATLPASFLTGTTTETAGVSPSRERASLIMLSRSGAFSGIRAFTPVFASYGWFSVFRSKMRQCKSCRMARFLGTHELPRNRHEAAPRGPRQRLHLAVAVDHEAEPPRREPIAHQKRAERPRNGAGDDIARMMRQHDHPARLDGQRREKHDGAQARADQADRNQRREHIGGMAGRQARIFGPPAERHVEKRVGLAADERPRPPDQPLDDGNEKPRQCNRSEDESKPD